MVASYTDLQTYRACPRLFGFAKLGYKPAVASEPLTISSLVHAGLVAHFKGEVPVKAMELAASERVKAANLKLGTSETYDYEKEMFFALKRAYSLLDRYILSWAKDYKATLAEPELKLDGVIIHPDLIAYYKEKRVIVDYKTSYHPDDRWYDMSGQADLYAYVVVIVEKYHLPRVTEEPISFVIYDIISEEGLFRVERPPRLEAGKRLFYAVQALNNLITRVKPEDEHKIRHYGSIEKLQAMYLLDDPHPDYTCPSQCNFFHPCWLLETSSWEDCKDFLEENFLKC